MEREDIDPEATREMPTLEMTRALAPVAARSIGPPGLRLDVEVTSEYTRVTIELDNPSVSYDAGALTTLVSGLLREMEGGGGPA